MVCGMFVESVEGVESQMLLVFVLRCSEYTSIVYFVQFQVHCFAAGLTVSLMVSPNCR